MHGCYVITFYLVFINHEILLLLLIINYLGFSQSWVGGTVLFSRTFRTFVVMFFTDRLL